MRKALMVLAVTLMVAFAASGVAWAVVKTCDARNCRGTERADLLYERPGGGLRDHISGLRRGDVVDANTFGQDRDVLEGNRGGDRLLANDGDDNDTVRGGPGRDVCYVDVADAATGCEDLRVSTVAGQSGVSQDLPAEAF